MREIILDTETTGIEPGDGHRIVEIGCVEVVNYVATGRHYHCYINPERDVPAEVVAVHGLTTEFLRDKPVFSQVYTDLLDFIGDAHGLVIHNAAFDMKFLNHELAKVGHGGLKTIRVTDTVDVARKKFPGSPASLDALCRRYEIDLAGRELHGALLDAQLLAAVYLELMGGRQHGLGLAAGGLAAAATDRQGALVSAQAGRERVFREPRPYAPSAEELAAHAAMVADLKDALWATE